MTGLTDAQRALVADPKSLDFARRVAGRWSRVFPRLADEFSSCAFLGLCRAAVRYRPEVATWKTFAARYITGAILDHVRYHGHPGFGGRKGSRPPNCCSLDELGLGFDHCDVSGPVSPEGPIGWEIESADTVERLCRSLPSGWRGPIRAFYLEANVPTMRAVGESFNKTESWFSGLHRQAVECWRDLDARGELTEFGREH